MIDLTTLLMIGGVLVLGWALGKYLFRKDEEIEDRRRQAFKLATKLSEYGLTRIPDVLGCYAVGDYSGLGDEVSKVYDLFASGEEAILKEFNAVFLKVLEQKLKTKEGRALIAAELKESVEAGDPSAITSAPQAEAK